MPQDEHAGRSSITNAYTHSLPRRGGQPYSLNARGVQRISLPFPSTVSTAVTLSLSSTKQVLRQNTQLLYHVDIDGFFAS